MGASDTKHAFALKQLASMHPDVQVACMCPHCGAVFMPWKMEGDLNRRLCPKCKEQILPVDYDRKAKHLIAARLEYKEKLQELQPKFDHANKVLSYFDFILLRPFKRLAYKFVKKVIYAYNSTLEQRKSNERKIIFAAKDRYYVSEFFQLTHIPLISSIKGKEITIHPYYDKEAIWHFPHGTSYNMGLYAEQQVFYVLLRESLDPRSPLYGSRLVPNLYFPRHAKEGRDLGRFWDQTDLIVLTKSAAIIIEVKSRHTNIVANAPFTTIYSSNVLSAFAFDIRDTKNESLWSDRETSALTQNSTHAVSFSAACTSYSYQDIFEQCVFVGPETWKSNSKRFIENVNVSFLTGSTEAFLVPIKNLLERKRPKLTQDEVNMLADSFIVRYGDLRQTCANMHVERIKKLQDRDRQE